jgi:hypothetical protein
LLSGENSKNSGMAAKVPKVPGALGAKPLPKPSAKKWIGFDSLKFAVEFFIITL